MENRMTVKNIRWGADEGEITCGPAGCSLYVEVMVTETDGSSAFALLAVYENAEKVWITPVPVFDIVTHMADSDSDFDAELQKVQRLAIETYDYECDYPPLVIVESEYAELINLARMVMRTWLQTDDEDDEPLQELVQSALGQDLNHLNMKFVACVLPEDEEETDE